MANGWPTRRRTQGTGGLPGCLFACAEGAEDSIEHYAVCGVLAERMHQLLRLPRPPPEHRLADFLGVVNLPGGPDAAVLRAVRLAAVYRLHCQACHGRLPTGRPAREALAQACREVVRGSRRGEHVYDAAAGGWA